MSTEGAEDVPTAKLARNFWKEKDKQTKNSPQQLPRRRSQSKSASSSSTSLPLGETARTTSTPALAETYQLRSLSASGPVVVREDRRRSSGSALGAAAPGGVVGNGRDRKRSGEKASESLSEKNGDRKLANSGSGVAPASGESVQQLEAHRNMAEADNAYVQGKTIPESQERESEVTCDEAAHDPAPAGEGSAPDRAHEGASGTLLHSDASALESTKMTTAGEKLLQEKNDGGGDGDDDGSILNTVTDSAPRSEFPVDREVREEKAGRYTEGSRVVGSSAEEESKPARNDEIVTVLVGANGAGCDDDDDARSLESEDDMVWVDEDEEAELSASSAEPCVASPESGVGTPGGEVPPAQRVKSRPVLTPPSIPAPTPPSFPAPTPPIATADDGDRSRGGEAAAVASESVGDMPEVFTTIVEVGGRDVRSREEFYDEEEEEDEDEYDWIDEDDLDDEVAAIHNPPETAATRVPPTKTLEPRLPLTSIGDKLLYAEKESAYVATPKYSGRAGLGDTLKKKKRPATVVDISQIYSPDKAENRAPLLDRAPVGDLSTPDLGERNPRGTSLPPPSAKEAPESGASPRGRERRRAGEGKAQLTQSTSITKMEACAADEAEKGAIEAAILERRTSVPLGDAVCEDEEVGSGPDGDEASGVLDDDDDSAEEDRKKRALEFLSTAGQRGSRRDTLRRAMLGAASDIEPFKKTERHEENADADVEARKPLLSKSLDQLKRETILLKVRDIETDLRFPRYQTVGEAMGTMWRKLKLEAKEKDYDVCIVRSGVWLCRSRQIGSYGMKDQDEVEVRRRSGSNVKTIKITSGTGKSKQKEGKTSTTRQTIDITPQVTKASHVIEAFGYASSEKLSLYYCRGEGAYRLDPDDILTEQDGFRNNQKYRIMPAGGPSVVSKKKKKGLSRKDDHDPEPPSSITVTVFVEESDAKVDRVFQAHDKISTILKSFVDPSTKRGATGQKEQKEKDGTTKQGLYLREPLQNYVLHHPRVRHPLPLSALVHQFVKEGEMVVIKARGTPAGKAVKSLQAASLRESEKKKKRASEGSANAKKKNVFLTLNRFLRTRPSSEELLTRDILKNDCAKATLRAPVIKSLLRALRACNAKHVEGLFRVSASAKVVGEMYELMKAEGPQYDVSDHNAHEIAGLLKYYLREAPEPAIPFAQYDDFLKLYDEMTSEVDDEGLARAVMALPLDHLHILALVSHYLLEVVAEEDVNLMTITNIGIVFGPTLLRTEPYSTDFSISARLTVIAQHIVLHATELFGHAECTDDTDSMLSVTSPAHLEVISGGSFNVQWSGDDVPLETLRLCRHDCKCIAPSPRSAGDVLGHNHSADVVLHEYRLEGADGVFEVELPDDAPDGAGYYVAVGCASPHGGERYWCSAFFSIHRSGQEAALDDSSTAFPNLVERRLAFYIAAKGEDEDGSARPDEAPVELEESSPESLKKAESGVADNKSTHDPKRATLKKLHRTASLKVMDAMFSPDSFQRPKIAKEMATLLRKHMSDDKFRAAMVKRDPEDLVNLIEVLASAVERASWDLATPAMSPERESSRESSRERELDSREDSSQ